MGTRLEEFAGIAMTPSFQDNPESCREMLRGHADLISGGIQDAFEGGELDRDPLYVLAILDNVKSVITRSLRSIKRLDPALQELGLNSENSTGVQLNLSKPDIVTRYFSDLDRRNSAVVSLFFQSNGTVWCAIVSEKSGRLRFSSHRLVEPQRLDWFLDNLAAYISSLSTRDPDFDTLDLLLGELGSKLVPALILGHQPKHTLIIPHRRLHLLPLHACHATTPNGLKTHVVDATECVTYASSLFEALWGNLRFQTDDTSSSKRLLTVLDTNCENLEWPRLEHMWATAGKEMGMPVDIVNDPSDLPMSMESYLRISWGSHANSCLNLWAGSELCLGDKRFGANAIMNDWSLPSRPSVMLAACETGLDLSSKSEVDEYCGLDLAFRIAGASSVTSTLWQVSDPVAALASILVEQYEFGDHLKMEKSLAQFLLFLRKGSWQKHLATEEQMSEYAAPQQVMEKQSTVMKELRALDAREFTKLEHWAAWRCLSS